MPLLALALGYVVLTGRVEAEQRYVPYRLLGIELGFEFKEFKA
jgi:hypothetical protein